MAMGVADLIPGVSGGTIAFISGIYDQLLQALRPEKLSKANVCFLGTLGLGIGTSIVLFSRLVHHLLAHYAIFTWSFFFGLIAASVVLLLRDTVAPLRALKVSSLLLGIVGGFFITGLVPVETPESLWFIALTGFVAISAMILPGLSGSFLLLILGKYELILSVLKNPFKGNHLVVMACFAAGCILGLLTLSRVLSSLLKKYPMAMVSFLAGLLIGSLRKIWPWKEVVETMIVGGKEKVIQTQNILPPLSSEVVYAFLWAVIGVVAILLIDYLHIRSTDTREAGVTG